MSHVGTFEGYKVTASGRIASRVTFPRADYAANVAALPDGWRLVGGKRADPDRQYFDGDTLTPRPRLVEIDEIQIAISTSFAFDAPEGTELIERRSKTLIEIVHGKAVIEATEPGVHRYSLVPPSPYQRQTLTMTVTGERPVTAAEVKAECERRILARYAIGKQMTLMDRGGAELDAMRAFRDATIEASHRLEAMTPIPSDFTLDHHWPA